MAPEADQVIMGYGITPKKHELIHTFLKQIEEISLKRKKTVSRVLKEVLPKLWTHSQSKKAKNKPLLLLESRSPLES